MNFKTFLAELTINSRSLSKVAKRLGSSARIGFEFEMWLPESSRLFALADDSRNVISIGTLDSIEEIAQFFDVERRFITSIEREYEEWLNKAQAQFVDDNWEKHYDDDLADAEGETEARQQAYRDAEAGFTESDYEFRNFVDDEYRSMYNFLMQNTGGPQFGWARDTGNDRATFFTTAEDRSRSARGPTFDAIKRSLKNELGITVREGTSATSIDFEVGVWVLTEDGSIVTASEEAGVGAELVSPPLPLTAALKWMKRVFDWMEDQGAVTNKSTGFHINVSVPGISDVDKLKLVLFMGDRYVLQQFNRLGNTFSTSQYSRIINSIKLDTTPPKELQSMRQLASSALDNEKYRSVNFSKLDKGYLEFRAVGGMNYHRQAADIENTVLRYVAALEVASDPKLEREEYIKKLTLLMGKLERSSAKPDMSDRSIFWVLRNYGSSRVDNILDKLEALISSARRGSITLGTAELFVELLHETAQVLEDHPLTRRQAVELRIAMRHLQLTADDLMLAARKGNLQNDVQLTDTIASLRK